MQGTLNGLQPAVFVLARWDTSRRSLGDLLVWRYLGLTYLTKSLNFARSLGAMQMRNARATDLVKQ
jgi:hypothetical protein